MAGERKAQTEDEEAVPRSPSRVELRKWCARLKPNPALLPLKVFYFLQLGGISTLFLYVTLYMDQVIGLTKSEIAVTSFLAPFISFFSRLTFGTLADRTQKFRLVLFIVVVGNACSFDLLLSIPAAPRTTSASSLLFKQLNSSALHLCLPAAAANRTAACKPHLPPQLSDCVFTCPDPPPPSPPSLPSLARVGNASENCAPYAVAASSSANLSSLPQPCNLTCSLPCTPATAPAPPWTGPFWQALFWRTLGYFLFTPSLTLADTITMALLEPDRRKQYGGTRLFGSVGFFAFSLITSAALKLWGGSLVPTFVIYSLLALLSVCAIAAMRVPEGIKCSNSLRESFHLLFISTEVQIFFLFALLSGVCMAVIENYVFITIKAIMNPNDAFFGLLTACMVISETPVMAISGYIIAKLGELTCIWCGFLFWALRFFVYSIMTRPWQVLLNELLHGLTFAIVFPSLVTYGSRLAPQGAECTMQGMISGMHLGLGVALGGLVGGVLLDLLGYHLFFVVCSIYCLVCAASLFLLQCLYLRRRTPPRQEQYMVAMSHAEDQEAAQTENGQLASNHANEDDAAIEEQTPTVT